MFCSSLGVASAFSNEGVRCMKVCLCVFLLRKLPSTEGQKVYHSNYCPTALCDSF